MRLTETQINEAIALFEHVESNSTIDDDIAQRTKNLYEELHQKPIFPSLHFHSNELADITFYTQPERVKYIAQFALTILPIMDLMTTVGKLPLQRDEPDFKTYIKNIFHNYIEELAHICSLIPPAYNFFTFNHMDQIRQFSQNINSVIEASLYGRPSEAFTTLENTLEQNRATLGLFRPFNPHNEARILYKMRVGTNHQYSNDEMFHIPFEKRGLVSTNRYSIPGLPCVYLGSSTLDCWEELGRPDLNTVQTNLFYVTGASYLDISMPPLVVANYLKEQYSEDSGNILNEEHFVQFIVSYVLTWPLIAACSVRVQNPSHTFKPEYIVPQLLLQWIRQSNYDGICFFSTKIEDYDWGKWQLYRNYAFPVQTQEPTGHCTVLRSKFNITDAVPWQTFNQFYDGSGAATANEHDFPIMVEYIKGFPINYDNLAFSRLEMFLINYYRKNFEHRPIQP